MQECLLRSDLALELFGVPITDTWLRWRGGGGCSFCLFPFSAEAVPRNYRSADFTDSKLQTVTFQCV